VIRAVRTKRRGAASSSERFWIALAWKGVVTLADASTARRRAAQRLLGRLPRAGRALSVSSPAVEPWQFDIEEELVLDGLLADLTARCVDDLGDTFTDPATGT
jgi:hypothetical protein